MSLWSESCFLAASWQSQHLSVKKNKKMRENNALEMVPDQTQLRLKTFMIRSNCSNPPMIRLFRPKWPLIRPSPDHDQTVVRSNFRKDPVISVWEHTGVRSTGSDQKSIWVWTSTWVAEIIQLLCITNTVAGRSDGGRLSVGSSWLSYSCNVIPSSLSSSENNLAVLVESPLNKNQDNRDPGRGFCGFWR